MNTPTVFEDVGIEVTLKDESDFLKIAETLTRIGIASKFEKKLYQSCHILHKRGKFRILHFKELFALDGKPTNFTEDDLKRRNVITKLLYNWGLINLSFPLENIPLDGTNIRVLSFKDKHEFQLIPKYKIGKKQNEAEKIKIYGI